MNVCAEKCGARCTCHDDVMCDDCIQFEIDRLDAHYADGRRGFICATCRMPAWEPQGGTVCDECASPAPVIGGEESER
jgi:hypothetical protein